MRCEAAERELSARMDGDRGESPELEPHLDRCARCRAFARSAARIRETVRLEPADAVPDLVPAIMARVAAEPRARLAPRRWVTPERRRLAAAFTAAALAAAILAGAIPGFQGGGQPALAAARLPRLVANAAGGVDAYEVSFSVWERNFHQAVPVRRFDVTVAFRAPERLRIEVRDRSTYPSPEWADSDVTLAADEDRWLLSAPETCPRQALPTCPPGRRTTAVVGREPFDRRTQLPTDIVLPLTSLSESGATRVLGEERVLGRRVVTVALPYRDAAPLFAFQAGGVWRPFFPQDVVHVSLDRESWFPLALRIYPSEAAERDRWALSHGLPPEPAGREIFRMRARSFDVGEASLGAFGVTSVEPRDEGFRDVSPEALAGEAGFAPLLPGDLRGLAPHRFGLFEGGTEVLLSYARGLSWLKIRETRDWGQRALFGDVGPLAIPIRLPGGGLGYYEPATGSLGRRLSLHARGWDLYLESNLPREDLLAVAASLPLRGTAAPEDWRLRRWAGGSLETGVALDEAIAAVPGLLLPDRLPAGYRRWTIHLLRADDERAATVYYRRSSAELGGEGIRLHQAAGAALPPPMDPDVLAVEVRGVTGRYAVTRGEMEWVEDGVYRSLRAEGLDLEALLDLASSLRPAEAGS